MSAGLQEEVLNKEEALRGSCVPWPHFGYDLKKDGALRCTCLDLFVDLIGIILMLGIRLKFPLYAAEYEETGHFICPFTIVLAISFCFNLVVVWTHGGWCGLFYVFLAKGLSFCAASIVMSLRWVEMDQDPPAYLVLFYLVVVIAGKAALFAKHGFIIGKTWIRFWHLSRLTSEERHLSLSGLEDHPDSNLTPVTISPPPPSPHGQALLVNGQDST